MTRQLSATIFATVAMLAWVASAGAVDGTIEINQAKVMAAGGFPYNINAGGSYRLTGNLTVSSTTADAIDVNASNVTIDLNGFSVVGPGASASGAGINQMTGSTLTVENGSISGFGKGAGVAAGNNSIVRNVQAISDSDGIQCLGSGCVISHNVANFNSKNGIECGGAACLIEGNTIVINMVWGILASDSTSGYGGNVLENAFNVSGGTSLGAKNTNLCGGTAC